MVAASISASILLAGLSSSLFIALRATETAATPTSSRIKANAALGELQADLEFALAFTEQSPNAIAFLVPDRDGDGQVETLRYAWSGTPGDPLTKQSNGGTVAAILEDVHLFQHDLPAARPNLLANPGMEAGTPNWEATTGATLNSVNSPVHQGGLSALTRRNTASNESGLRQIVTSQLANGTTYQMGGWVRKTTAALPYDVKLQLRLTSTGNGTRTFAAGVFPISSGPFRRVKGFVRPTWSGTLLSAYWECTGVNKIQELVVDDAELRIGSIADQSLTLSLQVGPDPKALLQSGIRLINSPL
jgi:hypothetical protein